MISALDNPLPEVTELAKRAHWDLHRVASQAQLKAALHLTHPAALTWDLANARPGDWAMIQQIRSHPQLSQIPFILYRHEGVGDETSAVRMTNILMKPLSLKLWRT